MEVEPGTVSRHVEIIYIEPPKQEKDIEFLKFVPGVQCPKNKTSNVDVSDDEGPKIPVKQDRKELIDLTSPPHCSKYITFTRNQLLMYLCPLSMTDIM